MAKLQAQKNKMRKLKKQRSEPSSVKAADLVWVRIGILGLLLGIVLSSAYWLNQKLHDPSVLPIRSIVLDGNFQHVEKAAIEKTVSPNILGGYFTVDVSAIQARVKSLPWVAGASVRRVWPDTLVISVVEHTPYALWDEKELISDQGIVFVPASVSAFKYLPAMRADKRMAIQLLEQYNMIGQTLKGLDQIKSIERNARDGLSMTMVSGLHIELGKEEIESRLQRVKRFVKAFQQQISLVASIDARYSGGVAVTMKQADKVTVQQQGEPVT